MFNGGFKGIRAADGAGFVTTKDVAVQQSSPQPKITSWAYTNGAYVPYPDTAIAGGETIVIYGSGFQNNANVVIGATTVTSSRLDPNRITFTAPSLSPGSYPLYVANPGGGTAVYLPGVVYNSYPVWNSTSYANTFTTATSSVAFNLNATDSATLTFSLQSGSSLPTGLTLAANGYISGTTTVSSTTVYNFTVIATDSYAQATQASITYTITLNVSDTFFNYTTLLLNGETTTNTYIQDFSTNNYALTASGNANPNRFSPYWGNGYYGVSFDGSSGYMYVASATPLNLSSGDFTIECWFYLITGSKTNEILNKDGVNGSSYSQYEIYVSSSNTLIVNLGNGNGVSPTDTDYGASTSVSLNTWHHVVCQRTGTTISVYFDGTRVTNTAQVINMTDGGKALVLGHQSGASSDYFAGYISNMRIVKGTAVYSGSSFTPPTAPLTAIANTALLTCQSANFIDNSTNAYTITATGTVKVASNQPFGTVPSGVQNYGSALVDGGTTSYISVPGSTSLGSGSWTIEAWAYFTNTSSSYDGIICTGPQGTIQAFISKGDAGLTDGVGSSAGITYTTTYFQWSHYALVCNGTTLYMYINGVLVGSTARTYIPYGTTPVIGRRFANLTSYAMNGYISNARIVPGTAVYTSAFTPPTAPLTAITNTSLLTLQYKNGSNNSTFYDDSVNNFALTRTGTPTQGTFSPFSQTGWSTFIGYGAYGYMNVPANTGYDITTGDFTVEFWANFSTWNTMGSSGMVIATNFGSSSGWSIGFNGGVGSSMCWQTWNAGAAVSNLATTGIVAGTNFQLGQWNHFTVMQKTGTLYFFLNGVMTYSVAAGASVPAGNALYFGVYAQNLDYAGNPYFYLSNFRIVKGTAVYTTTNFTPSTSPLTAISGTTLLICQNNRHLDNSSINAVITPTSSGTYPIIQPFSPFAPGVVYSSANNGGSIYFNGSTDYLTTPSTVNISTGNFTCEVWFYLTSTSVSGPGILCGTATGSIQFAIYGTAGIGLASQGVSWLFNTTSGIYLNTWYHVVLCRGGTGTNQTSLFLNGTRILNGTVTANFGNYTLAVGAVGTSYPFPGYISNLKFTNGVDLFGYSNTTIPVPTAPPTPTANTSLLLLGTNTGIQDATGKNDILTTGSVLTQSNTVKFGTGSMYFNSSASSYATVPLSTAIQTITGNFTLEFWLNPLTLSGTVGLMGQRSVESNYCPILLEFSGSTLQLYVSTTGTSWAVSALGSGSLSTNTWTHVAITRSGTTVYYFINGTSVGSTGTASGPLMTPVSPLYIGRDSGSPSADGYFNGYIDEFRITNGVARYTGNFTPPATTFLAQ